MKFVELTRERWTDLEDLFGARGACGGCWCMWWRLPRSLWKAQKGAANKQAFFEIVGQGMPPGVLAYRGEQAVGWCAVGPRESYPTLEQSRSLKRIDDMPVWSVTCFFVRRRERRKGVSVALLEAAAGFASKHGAQILEGYPVKPSKKGETPDAFAYTGTLGAFLKAGFVECGRPGARPVLRRKLY